METEVLFSDNEEVRRAQVVLLRKGMSEFKDADAISEEDLKLIEEGKISEVSLKSVYWAKRFYKEGVRLHKKEQSEIAKTMNKPATLGEVGMYVRELVYGDGGIKQGLDAWSSSINRYVMIMGEALRMKGLLTPEDLDAAAESLRKQAEEDLEKVSAEAKDRVDHAMAVAKELGKEEV